MKLVGIKIVGYKSIEELEFPIKKYGKNGSYTTILLGKNETGKSNVLEAMATPQKVEDKETVNFIKIKNQQKEPDIVSVFFTLDYSEDESYREYVSTSINIPDNLLSSVKISRIIKEIYIYSGSSNFQVDFDFDYEKINVKDYSFAKLQYVVTEATPLKPAVMIDKISIKENSEVSDEENELYTQLDKDGFNKIIKDALITFVDNITIPIDIWKAESKYLIQDKVQLKEFAQSPETNIPLKNMFYLAGYQNKEAIEKIVAEIEKDDNKRRKLYKALSTKTTDYLNKKWKEHEIVISVEIESNLTAGVSVQDKSDENSYFDMSDRSQGFKQFVSLLLSISISSVSGNTKGHLILIDEPEVHLHPSGVRWMLEELLEIGKNNYLFISTHSDFMLDRDTKERHYLLTKGKDNLTRSRQIKSEEDISDDEILKSAFGINVIADFLSKHKLLVEGASDKKLLLKALKQVKADHDILITNGNGSNLPSIVSIMNFQDINPVVITDDDKAGKDMKSAIAKIDDKFKPITFTIRDLNGDIIDGGTIEDTLPKDFVTAKINEILSKNSIADISLQDSSPFCEQIIFHLQKEISEEATTKKDKKQKIDEITVEFKSKVAEYDQKAITQVKTPKLYKLAEGILDTFGINRA